MIVCICRRVSDRDIAHATQEGCTTFDELQDELGVATACGKCRDCARETFHHHLAGADSSGAAALTCAGAAGDVASRPRANPHVHAQHAMNPAIGA